MNSKKTKKTPLEKLEAAVREWRKFYRGCQDYYERRAIWGRELQKADARLGAARRAMEKAAKPEKTIGRYLRAHAAYKALEAAKPTRPESMPSLDSLRDDVLMAAWALVDEKLKEVSRG